MSPNNISRRHRSLKTPSTNAGVTAGAFVDVWEGVPG
jgi:hypothetical protein